MLQDLLRSCRKDVKLIQVECSLTCPRQHCVFLRRLSGEGKISQWFNLPGAPWVSIGARSDFVLLLKDTILVVLISFSFLFFFLRFCLFIFREGKKRRKRGREIAMCSCLSPTPYWGPGPQPRHVSWLGMEPVTLWFTGWHSLHWTTPAKGLISFS